MRTDGWSSWKKSPDIYRDMGARRDQSECRSPTSSKQVIAVLTVRNLPDEVRPALRVRAAVHGRSTEAELRFGVVAMPAGKRQAIYQERLERDVLTAFAGRVLSFDLDAAQRIAFDGEPVAVIV